jgi:hypothetical protein
MKATPKILESIYCLICQLPPVNKWKMPNTAEIDFKVTDKVFHDGEECYATYTFNGETDLHEILISREMNPNFTILLSSMLHECIHIRRLNKSEDWHLHDAVFKKYAKEICENYGLERIGF